MSKIHDGGPAFPDCGNILKGMTLRDYFAVHALGIGFDWTAIHETGGYAEAAQVAYEVADAMLAERAKGGA